MKGIILHGGHGTRLRPLTHTGPKQLLPIANKPMSQYCLEAIKEVGVNKIAVVIGGIGASKVREFYGSGKQFGVELTYVEQDSPRGIAHAISLCKDFVGNDKFIVFLGDNILKKSLVDFAHEFESSKVDATVLLCEVDNPTRFGIADIDDKGKITKIMEKPKTPPTNLAVTGIYFLTPKIFEIIQRLKPSWRNELEITDALQMLIEESGEINYYKVTDYWKDTGTPEDIIHANQVILEDLKPYFHGKKEDGASIEGKVTVGDSTIIESEVMIKGPVIIGKNCQIGSHSDIGPNVSIGDNCSLKDCRIEDSIIMDGCRISSVHIKNSIIAFNSEIKSNSEDNGKIFLLGEGSKIAL